ncbi:hypothetical protein M0R45_031150 [Rubus argutus]|uniref:Uncharacterized protein n=1 Tax=Rubus argutus TaxID=59490 RepID=A0AAW1WH96_RUBAR
MLLSLYTGVDPATPHVTFSVPPSSRAVKPAPVFAPSPESIRPERRKESPVPPCSCWRRSKQPPETS